MIAACAERALLGMRGRFRTLPSRGQSLSAMQIKRMTDNEMVAAAVV